MKTLALLLFLAGSSACLADNPNILQNGDFSDGISHWEGDCHTAGGSSDDSGSTAGVVVKLRDGEWTKVSQDFEGKAGNYLLTITYAASPGIGFSQRPEDYTNTTLKLGLAGLGAVNTTPGEWVIILNDTGVHYYTYWQVMPKLDGTGTESVNLRVNLKTDGALKGFFLGFPPGSGFINLQSITMTSMDAAPAPAQ